MAFSLADLQRQDREKMKLMGQQQEIGAMSQEGSALSSKDLAKAQAVQQLVGLQSPSQSGSESATGGAISGAASGALTGASIGGAPGAVIGGGVGALKGVLGARANKKKRQRDAEVQKQQSLSNIASEKTVRVQSAIQEMARNLGASLR